MSCVTSEGFQRRFKTKSGDHMADNTDRDFGDDETEFDFLEPLLLTSAEAAHLLGISVGSLQELVKRDQIRPVEFVATGFKRPIKRFRMQELEDFIERSVR